MEEIIKVEGLKKYYGETRAVEDISFQVERGELFGFLGVNGAGKSTTINMLCTLLEPTGGRVEVCGKRLGKENQEIRKRIGVVWQNNCMDGRLTVAENMLLRGALYGQHGKALKENVAKVARKLQIEELMHRRFSKLSGGQKRRGEIAAALVNTPEILFLDEPTTGLDPAARKNVWDLLEELRAEGTTVFLTTHYMEEAAQSRHIAVMDKGKLKEYGTPFELKERFATDRLRLIPAAGAAEGLERLLQDQEISFIGIDVRSMSEQNHGGREYQISLKDSMEALPLLKAAEGLFTGFELVQGTMDDVFLRITESQPAQGEEKKYV